MRRIVAVAASLAIAAGVLVLGTIAATAASCTGTVEIGSFAFNPPAVIPGQSSTLTLVAENCTGQPIQANDVWSGRYVGPDGTTIPPGCPVIDPIVPNLPLPANGEGTASQAFSTFVMCPAVALKMTVTISSGGVTLASQTATLTIGSASTSPSAPPTCTGTAQINSFAFNPPVVNAGQSSTASAVVQNCTGQPIQASATWTARYIGSGSGIPPGCPAIDPVALNVALPANGKATTGLGYSTFAPCTATGLQATVTITSGGSTLASRTATLTIVSASTSPPPPSTCAVSYARQSEWSGGFVAQVTIANTGTAQVSGWTLAFTIPGDQVIGNAWNATVSQSGRNVTATNLAYNAVIAPGASTSFGFQGTWHSSDASPTAFTLNGVACTTR